MGHEVALDMPLFLQIIKRNRRPQLTNAMTEESRLVEAAREMWYVQRAENHIRRKPVEVPSRAVRVNMQPGRPVPLPVVRTVVSTLYERPMVVGTK
jgi:hypothetical protein